MSAKKSITSSQNILSSPGTARKSFTSPNGVLNSTENTLPSPGTARKSFTRSNEVLNSAKIGTCKRNLTAMADARPGFSQDSSNDRTLSSPGTARKSFTRPNGVLNSTEVGACKRNLTAMDDARPGCSQDSSDDDEGPAERIGVRTRAVRVNRKLIESDEESELSSPEIQDPTVSSRSVDFSSAACGKGGADIVGKCVHYLLIADQKKHIIKKQDILKHVFGKMTDHKLYQPVLEKASTALKLTRGVEIHEVRKHSYILVNTLAQRVSIRDFIQCSEIEDAKIGFLMCILAVIYMNGNIILESELWNALKTLGIDVTSRQPHSLFGDVKKLVTTDFVNQLYLKQSNASKEPPDSELSWGERASQEINKIKLLEFVCKIKSDTKPQDWLLQYSEAQKDEEKRKGTRHVLQF